MIRRNLGSGYVPVAPARDGGRPGLGSELGVDAVHVILDGLLGQHQLGRDLPVGVTLRDQGHDLGFAQGQAERAGQAGDAPGPQSNLQATATTGKGCDAWYEGRDGERKGAIRHNLHTIAWLAGAAARPAAARRAGQPTFEPVIRLLGTGWPFFIASNIRWAWAWSQTRTSPTASVSEEPMGTVVVSGWRSANATWMSWYS